VSLLSKLFVQPLQTLFFELNEAQSQLFNNFRVVALRGLLRVKDFESKPGDELASAASHLTEEVTLDGVDF